MTIPTEILSVIIGAILTIVITALGYLLKKQIEDLSNSLKELTQQKSETRERVLKLEVNYDNLISTIHELSTLIENTQETMHSLTIQMSELKSDIKGLQRG